MNTDCYCAGCKTFQPSTKSVSAGTEPELGSIYLCAQCGTVNTLNSLGWAVMTNNELKALSPDEAKDLAFAVRDIQAHVRNKRQQN